MVEEENSFQIKMYFIILDEILRESGTSNFIRKERRSRITWMLQRILESDTDFSSFKIKTCFDQ